MTPDQIDAYLARIGASRPGQVSAAALCRLQEQHLYTVPFENLSIHLGEAVRLDEPALLDKIVTRRRSGFCYELNGAFALLLRALGYQVTLLAAQVSRPDGTLGPPFDHLALRVDLDESWLVDVGFGAFSLRPLRISPEPQQDPAGSFTIETADNGDLQVNLDGKPVYLLENRPRELSDFGPTCWWQVTSPESHFTRSLTCSLPFAGGRVTLSGDKLIETREGKRAEKQLTGPEEVRSTYADRFGIQLADLPKPPVAATSA